jgi:hypothetical protein
VFSSTVVKAGTTVRQPAAASLAHTTSRTSGATKVAASTRVHAVVATAARPPASGRHWPAAIDSRILVSPLISVGWLAIQPRTISSARGSPWRLISVASHDWL